LADRRRWNSSIIDPISLLTRALSSRYLITRNEEDIVEVEALYRHLLESPIDCRGRSSIQLSLARSLVDHEAREQERSGYLEESIILCDELLATISESDPSYPELLYVLGLALQERFSLSCNAEDIEMALQRLTTLVGEPFLHHEQRHRFLYALGMALIRQYRSDGNIEHVEQAVTAHREALARCGTEAPERYDILVASSASLFTLFMATRDVAYVEESLAHCREAFELAADVRRPAHFITNRIAALHLSLHDITSDKAHLVKSIYYSKRGLRSPRFDLRAM
jgi:hypothetical protein